MFSAKARMDILALHDYIPVRRDELTATQYLARVEKWCLGLSTFPQRGSLRGDIRPSVRVGGFERRISIGFQVTEDMVIILRVLMAAGIYRRWILKTLSKKRIEWGIGASAFRVAAPFGF